MKNTEKKSKAVILRQKAVELLNKRPINPSTNPPIHPSTNQLFHELEVHRIELEMQNIELLNNEKNLKLEAEKYIELYNFAPVGYFTLDKENIITHLNLAGALMLGKDRKHLLNEHFENFVTEETLPVFNTFLEDVFNSETNKTCEITLYVKGFSPVSVLLTGIVSEQADQCLLSVVDVTKQKLAEEALRLSNQKWQTIVEASPDGLGIAGLDGKLLYMSDKLAEMYGYSKEEKNEFIGHSVFDFIDSSYHKALSVNINRLISGDSNIKDSEYLAKRKDNTRFYAELNSKLVLDPKGNPESILYFQRDISIRKSDEKELKKLSQAVEQSSAIICITDNKGTIEYSNKKLLELSGYTINELIGENPRIFKSGEQTNEVYRVMWGTICSGNEWKGEFHNKKKNGELYWVSAFISPIFDAAGEITHFLAIQEDITKRKQAEKDIYELNTTLESKISERTSQLAESNRNLEIEIEVRKRAENFEKELLLLSVQLTAIHASEIPAALNMSLSKIGEFLSADRAYIFELNQANKTMSNTYEWCNKGVKPEIENLKDLPQDIFPVWMATLKRNETIIIPNVNELPDTWRYEREILEPQGIKSLIVIPIKVNNNLFGFVGLDSVHEHREYNVYETNTLKIWSNLLASLFNKKLADFLLEQSRQNFEIFFNTIDDFIFVITEDGMLIHTNNSVINRLGFTKDELIQQSIMKVHSPDNLEEAERIFDEMLSGENKYYSISLTTKYGEDIPIDIRATYGFWDGQPVLFAIGKDTSQIQLSEQKYSKTFHSNFSIMSISSFEDDTFIDVNDAFVTKSGYSREEVIGKTFLDINLFVLLLEPKAFIENLKRNLPVKDVEITVITKSGDLLFGLFSAEKILVGKDLCLMTSIVDLTELKKIQTLLDQSLTNFENFFNTIDDFLFVLDEKGNIIHANSTVLKRLEYSPEELTGKSVLMVHPAERREEAGRIVGEMLAGTSEFCPVPLITKSEAQISVETRVKAGLWNGEPAIFGVTKDITKIKLSEEKFSKAFHSSSALMAISNLQWGRYIDVNESFLKVLGYSREEIIGKTSQKLNIFVNLDIREEIADKIKQNIPVRDVELEVRKKSGDIMIGLFSAESIYIGSELCLLTLLVDITDRKLAEEQLKEARHEADRANLAKSEFLSRMSHELRTPLNSILGFAQLIKMGEQLNSAQNMGVDNILNSGRHLLNLINEVLDMARIESGYIQLNNKAIMLGDIIEEVIENVTPLATKHQLTIELSNSSANQLFVMADSKRLKQVLLNLLSNAIKYNRTGGSVFIETEKMPKNISGIVHLRVSISDTGEGISAENIPNLFNPFERFGAESSETEGSGLGLPIVKKLMDAMGGNVGVKSVFGQGSTFWIELPWQRLRKKDIMNNREYNG